MERAEALVENGAFLLCVDVAHAYISVKEAVSLKNKFGDNIVLMAGNVATAEVFSDLEDWGQTLSGLELAVVDGSTVFKPATVFLLFIQLYCSGVARKV